MAIRGAKPTATVLKLITGNPGKRDLPKGEPVPVGQIEKPKRMPRAASVLWDRFIARAFWLTWADGPKALMWCHLQSEFEKSPTLMLSSRIAQLRALGSELGMDPASRARLGAKDPDGKQKDAAAKYLD